jgi:hypothetical protein
MTPIEIMETGDVAFELSRLEVVLPKGGACPRHDGALHLRHGHRSNAAKVHVLDLGRGCARGGLRGELAARRAECCRRHDERHGSVDEPFRIPSTNHWTVRFLPACRIACAIRLQL